MEENNDVRTLEDELARMSEQLETLSPGSKEWAAVADAMASLYARQTDQFKALEDAKDKEEKRELDERFRQGEADLAFDKAESEQKDRKIGRWLQAAGIILPLGLYSLLFKQGMDFERNEPIRTTMFRRVLGDAFGALKPGVNRKDK